MLKGTFWPPKLTIKCLFLGFCPYFGITVYIYTLKSLDLEFCFMLSNSSPFVKKGSNKGKYEGVMIN